MNYYPVFLNLKNRLCVVFGGGNVARRKVENLIKYTHNIRVVAPEISKEILKFQNKIEIIFDEFSEKYLDNAFLVFACTDNKELNNMIYNIAKKKNILVNNITSRDNLDFIVPSIIDKGKIKIALISSGASPALTKLLKKRIEEIIEEDFIIIADIMEKIREKQLTLREGSDKNREKFYKFLQSEIIEYIKKKDLKKINRKIKEIFGFEIEL